MTQQPTPRRLIPAILALSVAALLGAGLAPASAADVAAGPVQVTGRVVDIYSHKPFKNWHVVDSAGNLAVTDRKGRFALPIMRAAGQTSITLSANSPEVGATKTRTVHLKNATKVKLGTIGLSTTFAVSGHLLGAGKAPVSTATVNLYHLNGSVAASMQTDASGGFYLTETLNPGKYKLSASAAQWFPGMAPNISSGFWYSDHGPVGTFAKADVIVLRNSSAKKPLGSFVNKKLVGHIGTKVSFRYVGGYGEDGLPVEVMPVKQIDQTVIQGYPETVTTITGDGLTILTADVTTQSLPAGSYILEAFPFTGTSGYNPTQTISYWAGKGRPMTTNKKKAKVITIKAGEKLLKLGTVTAASG